MVEGILNFIRELKIRNASLFYSYTMTHQQRIFCPIQALYGRKVIQVERIG